MTPKKTSTVIELILFIYPRLSSSLLPSLRALKHYFGTGGWILVLGVVAAARAPASDPFQPDLIHHQVYAKIDPVAGTIEVADNITLPNVSPATPVILNLSDKFTLEHSNPTLIPIEIPPQVSGPPKETSRLGHRAYRLNEPSRRIAVRYSGTVRAPHHNGKAVHTLGSVSEQGVYLDGAARWILHPPGQRFTFALKTELIDGWQAVSQGQKMADGSWRATTPQREIYLIAGPLKQWRLDDGGKPPVSAFLRQPDPALAERYNRRARHYIDLYSKLVGPYPYPKFALIENFWPSGLGMPSFTLLGSTVIRLPFILNSSFPHEIAHNWWGNGVYPDARSGNWSEGLTAYMADHLATENRGQGADYRRRALQKYRNFVTKEDDFPLRNFRGGHGARNQAVGYNKALMLFHMLRLRLGDEEFIEGLRSLFKEQLFKTATFDDVRGAFERVSKTKLKTFFSQWTERVGAPEIGISAVSVNPSGDHRYRITVGLTQRADPLYDLLVPIIVHLQNGASIEHHAGLSQDATEVDIEVSSPPTWIRVDPRFDVFRRLDQSEFPPSLGALFGATRGVIVLPTEDSPALRDAYNLLANDWQRRYGWKIVRDTGFEAADGVAVWFLGRMNLHPARMIDRIGKHFPIPPSAPNGYLAIDGKRYSVSEHSLAVTFRSGEVAAGWLILDRPESAARLARKLPHYSSFSYVVFAGPTVTMAARGTWAVAKSVLDYAVVATAPKDAKGAENLPPPALSPRPGLLQRFR